jgi:hypothetical protein
MFNKSTDRASEWISTLDTRYGKKNIEFTRDGDRIVAKLKSPDRQYVVGSMRVKTQRGDVFDMRTEVRVGNFVGHRARRDVWAATGAR